MGADEEEGPPREETALFARPRDERALPGQEDQRAANKGRRGQGERRLRSKGPACGPDQTKDRRGPGSSSSRTSPSVIS